MVNALLPNKVCPIINSLRIVKVLLRLAALIAICALAPLIVEVHVAVIFHGIMMLALVHTPVLFVLVSGLAESLYFVICLLSILFVRLTFL